MKILHIVGGDLKGGAARGAYWLHLGLKNLGIDSKILTNSETTIDDDSIVTISRSNYFLIISRIRTIINGLLVRIYPRRKKMIFSTGFFGIDITKTNEYNEADIIQLHWINENFINIKSLSKIKKPLIWTLRDMWPFTGGCHIAEVIQCTNYMQGCGNCKQLGSNKSNDLSKLIYKRKKKYLPKKTRIIGISNWISQKARESLLLKDFNIMTISNNIDIESFTEINKKFAREILQIKTTKKIISFGAASLTDKWKGFDILLQALEKLDHKDFFLIIFGNNKENLLKNSSFEYKYCGYLNNNYSLSTVYSASNVFVSPSYIESFGKTIAESMLCGTPAVCFDATGSKDIISHKIDGYLAKSFDITDLAYGISWIANSPDYSKLSKMASNKIKNKFSSNTIAKKYKTIYQELL